MIAHLQALFIPSILGIKSLNKFNYLPHYYLIPFGFISVGIASMFEMIDHTMTDWVYVDHSSIFNWLFYASLSLGLSLFSISVSRNKFLIKTNILFCLTSIFSYWILGKPIALIFQVLISILLIISWQNRFKDWFFFAYPIFGILLTTFLGTNLSISGNQIWHLFIGPSGSISVLTFYLVLKRSKNKYRNNL